MSTMNNDPLHGKRLETIIEELVDFYGWEQLGIMVPIRCFTHDPSVKSSLHFLRRTPWARKKVEDLYLYMKEQSNPSA
jgi:uncharacterized protein (DUF2132 family)